MFNSIKITPPILLSVFKSFLIFKIFKTHQYFVSFNIKNHFYNIKTLIVYANPKSKGHKVKVPDFYTINFQSVA